MCHFCDEYASWEYMSPATREWYRRVEEGAEEVAAELRAERRFDALRRKVRRLERQVAELQRELRALDVEAREVAYR